MHKFYILTLIAVLLSGCGESVSEYGQNEKRDAAIRDVEKDAASTEDRLLDLEARVSVLENAAKEKP